MGGTPKSLSSLFLLLAIAVASVPSLSATAMADDVTPPSNTGEFQTEPVRAKVGDLTVVAPAGDWRFGRLRGRIEVIESSSATGRATYKIEATAVDKNGEVVEMRDRIVRLRAGQSAWAGYRLWVSEFGRETELEVAVWRQDGTSWVPVGTTSLTLRRRARVRDSLAIGAPVVNPPTGFYGIRLQNKTTGLKFDSIDFGPASSSERYRVNFTTTPGSQQGPTPGVDPNEDADINATTLTVAGFGAGTYVGIVNWSDGSKSTVTISWGGPGTTATIVLNDSTPRAMP